MNLWQKINQARTALLEKDIPKSGHNKHLGFKYMELEDFLPIITRINSEVGITAIFKTTGDAVNGVATLTLINSEKPEEREVFESPTAKANLNAKPSPVQELGAQHTYMRRYLYMEAYEIVEKDVVDGQLGGKADTEQPSNNSGKRDYAQELIDLAAKKGFNEADVLKTYKKDFGKEVSSAQYITKEGKMALTAKLEKLPDKG